MALLHIDDRLAGLAEVATRHTRPRQITVANRTRRVASTAADFPIEQVLLLTGLTIETLASGDGDLGALITPEAHIQTPTVDCANRATLAAQLRSESTSFTEIDVEITTLVVAASSVGAEWMLRARHTSPIDVGWARLEATGQSIVLGGALIGHVIANDAHDRSSRDRSPDDRSPRFDDIHLVYDTTSLLLQLALA